MAARARTARILAAAATGAVLAVGHPGGAPPAAACPTGHLSDPYTGQCYLPGGLPVVNGIPCIPGQTLGTCLGFLQNKPLPGGLPPPGTPWPR